MGVQEVIDRAVPQWLQPIKADYMTAGKLSQLLGIEGGGSFAIWFNEVKHRITLVETPPRGNQPYAIRRYLVKHVWAAAKAHGVNLVPLDQLRPVSELLEEIESLKIQARLAPPVKVVQRAVYIREQPQDDQVGLLRLLLSATEPRPSAGIYFLMHQEGDVVYVGQSENVLARMAGHQEKAFASVKMIHLEDRLKRLEVERFFIKTLKPRFNVMGNESVARSEAVYKKLLNTTA